MDDEMEKWQWQEVGGVNIRWNKMTGSGRMVEGRNRSEKVGSENRGRRMRWDDGRYMMEGQKYHEEMAHWKYGGLNVGGVKRKWGGVRWPEMEKVTWMRRGDMLKGEAKRKSWEEVMGGESKWWVEMEACMKSHDVRWGERMGGSGA